MKTKILAIGISLLMLEGCGDNCNKKSSLGCHEDNITTTTNIQKEPFALAQSVELSETQYFKVLSPKECTQKNKNRFIYQVMHDSYLWSTNVPQLDYDDNEFNSSELLLDKLRSPNDIFSSIEDANEIRNFNEGEVNNFGLGMEWIVLGRYTYALIVTHVSPNSPAHKAKFKRGDIIDSIDNQTITDNSIDAIEDAIFNKETVIFGIYDEKESKNITLTREKYNVEGILYSNQYQNSKGDKKIGYFVFQTFIESTIKEIDTQFNTFKKENIDELILDLRYNGGGSDEVANHLASLIGGSNVAQNVFHHVQ